MPAAFPQGSGTQTSPQTREPHGPQPEPDRGSQGTQGTASAFGRRRDREGARHGRVPTRETAADAAIRLRLVRLAAVPSLLVAGTCSAAAAFAVRAAGRGLTLVEWAVIGTAFLLIGGIVAVACAAANAEARATMQRYARLRQVCSRSQSDLYDLLHRVRQGEWLRHRTPEPLPRPTGGDTLDLLVHEVAAAGRAAETAVIDAVAIARDDADDNEQKVEVFVNLARRLQSLVHREIELLDDLENRVEDPDLLKGLFHVDHLATRIRRHAENLAVLGGAISRRRWTRPVSMTEVLRSAIAEVEQYPRVKLVPPIEGTLRGHAVADVIHLLAELIENATVYSSPNTSVLLRAQICTAGLAVEVEDRGLGMSAREQGRMNELLTDPESFDVDELLDDGRIGLYVVASLAERHGVCVRLQGNIYGGVQAVLIVPRELMGDEAAAEGDGTAEAGGASPATGAVGTAAGSIPAGASAVSAASGTAAVQAMAAVAAVEAGHAGDEGFGRGHERLDGHSGVGGGVGRGVGGGVGGDFDMEAGSTGSTSPVITAPVGNGDGKGSGSPTAEPLPRRRLVVRAEDAPGDLGAGLVAPPPGSPGAPATPATPSAPSGASGPSDLGTPSPDHGQRPRLPRRRKMEHLAPELRDGPLLIGSNRPPGAPELEHDPNLMAAFQRGLRLADAADSTPAGNSRNSRNSRNSGFDTPPSRPRGDDHNHGE